MHKHLFAASHPASLVLDSAWQKAMADTWLKPIEYSAGRCPPPEALAAHVDELLRLQNEGVLSVASVHIPFGDDWTPAHLIPEQRRNAARRYRAFMEALRPLNPGHFTLHPSQEPNKPEDRPALRAAFRETLLELAPVARDMGVSINVEILPRTCMGNTAEEMADMLDGMPGEVGVCFDVNHLCGHPEKIAPGIRLLADRVRALHLSDYDGVDECHWHPGLGVIDWAAVMEAVDDLPRQPLLIFEISPVTPPDWQCRTADPSIRCRNFERSAYFLEHAAELQTAIAAFRG